MKVVFCCRDNYPSKYIANKLYDNGFLQSLIVESQTIASGNKIKWLLRNKNILTLPVIFLDIIAFSVYSYTVNSRLNMFIKKEKHIKDFPAKAKRFYVSNINSDKSIQILSKEEPDVAVVYGTSILKEKVIKIPKLSILNIHSGVVPYYRNVHSDFWAYLNKDFNRIGVTIIHLDKGIDSGDIALQRIIKMGKKKSLTTVKKDNLILAGDLIVEALQKVEQKTLPRIQQKGKHFLFPTPGFLDIAKLFVRFIFSLSGK